MNNRERILKVAEDLFCEKGFSGTSMSEIAEKAGVAKSLIYHHFASKQALWSGIVQRFHEESGILVKLKDALAGTDPAQIIEMVSGPGGFFDFLRNNPRLVRLFSWVNLDREFEPEYPDDILRCEVVESLRQHQEAGWIRKDIDARIIPVVLLSVMVNWFSSKWTLSKWFDSGLSDIEMDKAYLSGAMEILLKGIGPGAQPN